jgi:ATP adenylyltransferase
MDKLYAPWRSAYIKKESNDQPSCPFCDAAVSSNDAAHFVLARYDGVLVMMNKFPYNTGHLLVIPAAHIADLGEATAVVRGQLMEAANDWIQILQKQLNCQGFNVGFNLGAVSGGSIPGHVHMHIVPRWQGDTNFLATIGNVKLISSDINEVYKKIIETRSGRTTD